MNASSSLLSLLVSLTMVHIKMLNSLCRREVFPDGILYASRESHYSVFKAARMYRMECVKVNTLVTGEIDCADFKIKLLPNKDKPAIINVNIGTILASLSLSHI